MDRESLSLPNSQFYTAAVSSMTNIMLSPIIQTPVDTEEKDSFGSLTSPSISASISANPNTPVFELTEEVTIKKIFTYDRIK